LSQPSATRLPLDRPADAVGRGIGFMVLSVLLFSCMDALVKWMAQGYPVVQIVFFRNLFAFVPIAIFLSRVGGVSALRVSDLRGHLLRGLVGVTSMFCFFESFARLPLGEAVALGQSGPLFLTALSVPLLAEKVGVRRWSAVVVGFAGVLLMTRPGAGGFDPAALFAIGGAFAYALAMISVRKLNRTESPAAIVFYFTLFALVASALALPFVWVTPDLVDFLMLGSIGLVGGAAQFAMTYAFRMSPVAVIAPYEYVGLVFAGSFGFAIWNDVPDAWLLAGAAVVVASGLYILHRETKLGRRRPRPAIHP
jgi:drug/metabolite transporter (DMT)-like permease